MQDDLGASGEAARDLGERLEESGMTINEYGIEAQKDFDAMWKSFEENSGNITTEGQSFAAAFGLNIATVGLSVDEFVKRMAEGEASHKSWTSTLPVTTAALEAFRTKLDEGTFSTAEMARAIASLAEGTVTDIPKVSAEIAAAAEIWDPVWQDASEDVAGLSETMKELGISGPESTTKVVVGVVDLDKAQKAATVTADGYADAVGDGSWADRFATAADKASNKAQALAQHFSAATRKAIDLIIAINNIPNAPSGTLPADSVPPGGHGHVGGVPSQSGVAREWGGAHLRHRQGAEIPTLLQGIPPTTRPSL